MSKDIRGVLFDLDGTLLDTHDLLLETFRHATRTVLGRRIPDELLMAKVGQPLVTQMWDFTDDAAVHAELVEEYRAYNAAIHDDMVRLFPGTHEALEALREAGFPLGVVTSKRHEVAARGLACFDLVGFFGFVVGSDDWPTHKPDPGPVLHGCDLMGEPPRACLYVGDSPFDMQAGRQAGCMTAAALWGMFPAADLDAERPDVACDSILEVAHLLGAR